MTDNELADADERAQLQDEIARLSGELAQVRKILGDREDDITRLRAALRRIVQWADAYPTDIFHQTDHAEAEIERLRAALRDFAFADVEWVRNRARRALEGKP